MTINYELAKRLKDCGFPYKWEDVADFQVSKYPTLSELIEACGDRFYGVLVSEGKWFAQAYKIPPDLSKPSLTSNIPIIKFERGIAEIFNERTSGVKIFEVVGPTLEDAVALLYLALNEKK